MSFRKPLALYPPKRTSWPVEAGVAGVAEAWLDACDGPAALRAYSVKK